MSSPIAPTTPSIAAVAEITHHVNNSNNNNHWFEKLTPTVQFCILASGVFFFFGIHNYLQEAIMSVPGFQYGVMLGYLEVFGVTVCSFFERRCIAKETKRVAPLSAYPLLTFCLMSSSSLSNLALNYINFPTKVYVVRAENLRLQLSGTQQLTISISPFAACFVPAS